MHDALSVMEIFVGLGSGARADTAKVQTPTPTVWEFRDSATEFFRR